VSWFGLPSATLGARAEEIGRIPWPAVGAYEAPRLPVSAREAFRGEGGEARLVSWPFVRGHPRVLAWARTGSSGSNRSGFLATAGNSVLDGTLVVASQSARGLQPLGPSGDHMIAGQGAWRPGSWSVTGALRSGRTGIEDIFERTERRAGEALRVAVARRVGRFDLELEAERSDEKLDYARDAIEFVSTRGRSDRARLTATAPGGAGETFASLTFGHDRLRSDADPAIETLEADVLWGAIGRSARLGSGWRAEAIVGAGKYGDDAEQIAPSLLVERDLRAGTTVWAGAARGLGGSIEPLSSFSPGDTVRFDAAHIASSLWLAGIGATLRSADERDPRTQHGPAPKGAYRARVAAYAGERDPGADAVRTLFAGSSVLAGPFEEVGEPTRFVALTATGAWAPVEGVKLEAGGHALGRTVDAALLPSDPEWRTFATAEGRQRWLHEDLDLRGGVSFELVGPRVGTPAGDLPTMTRVGLFAGIMLDEFDLRAELRNAAGSNRFLPVLDDFGSGPIRAEESRFLIELKWTFWD
jgi:hypothetical protein